MEKFTENFKHFGFNPEIFQMMPSEIQWHWATALGAFFLGIIIFSRPKGTIPHKTMGAIYMTLMIVTAVSAFFIRRVEITEFWQYFTPKGMTFIHLFVPLTFWGIFGGIWGIFVKKDAKKHSGPLIGSYIGGMLIAGLLTFIPGRAMHATFFWPKEKVEIMQERHEERKEQETE